jgi:DNA-binding helix-hairpin-helix protein with protein kinase domain
MRVQQEKTGRELALDGPPLARGGEATIYAPPGRPDLVAKVYHRPTPEHAAKLAVMLAAPPVAAGHPARPPVAWPVDRLLAADGGRVVGYLMPRVEGARRVCEVYNTLARRRACPSFHYGYLLRTARNLAAAVGALHRRGYVVGDLNESNVLVTPQALVTLNDRARFRDGS